MDLNIQVFVTGGTFDKEYNELNGNLYFKDTHLHEMLSLGRSKLNLSIESLMMKDSLDFVEEDRAIIASACNTSNAERADLSEISDKRSCSRADNSVRVSRALDCCNSLDRVATSGARGT